MSIKKAPASARPQLTPNAPIVAVAPSLAQLLACAAKKKKVQQADLARFLAAIGTYHVALGDVPAHFQSTNNAPVPVEVLAMLGKILVGRRDGMVA